MSRPASLTTLRSAAAWLSAAAGVAVATVTAAFPGGVSIPGIAPDHLAVILPLLAIPLAVHAFGAGVRRLAGGPGWAAQLARHYRTLSPATRIAALLLLVGAVVHLALLPAHLAAEPQTGVLFALDVAGFTVALALILTIRHWRIPAGAIALLTVVAYAYYIRNGLEGRDLVGVLTSGAELAIIPVALFDWVRQSWRAPSRRVATLAVAGLVTLLATGTVARAAAGTGSFSTAMSTLLPSPGTQSSMGGQMSPATAASGAMTPGAPTGSMTNTACPDVHGMVDANGMLMQPVPSTPPTASEVAATNQLIAATTAGIAQYADVNAALAAGYRPSTGTAIPVVHMLNPHYLRNDPLADPSKPQTLVYAHRGSKWVLLGAMYMTNGICKQGPDIGGSLTDWHAHTNLCFNAQHLVTGAHPDSSGQCPNGDTSHPTPFMLHIFTVPNNPKGPFELSKSAIVAALAA